MKKRLGFFLGSLAIGTVVWVGTSSTDAETTGQSMYRLYNPNTGEHFYTADKTEQQDLIVKGWTDEEIGWIAPENGDTVYRSYNPNVGEHLYTKSLKEYNKLALDGWVKEGTAFYSASSSGVPIYRVYNSNQFAFNHHYTKSEQESKHLTQLGWSDEGIAFYGMNDSTTPETSTVTINYIDTTGNKIKDSTTESVESGKDFTATAPSISEYTIQGETSQTLTNVTSNQSITFTYQKNASTTNYTVTVNYIDANDSTKKVGKATTISIKKGESYTAAAPTIQGYTLKGDTNQTIDTIDENTSLTFEYVSNTTSFNFSTSDDGSATITGFSEGQEGSTTADIPHYVINEGIIYSVVSIGSYAFPNEGLTNVTIPNTITSIEDNAFTSNKLRSINIPNSVTSIGNGAFSSNQLTTVEIPNRVTIIGTDTFTGNQLTSVNIPNSVTSIGNGAFANNILNSVNIPNSVTFIGNIAFAFNDLKSVYIPQSVLTIGERAFYYNSYLTEASIPDRFSTTYGDFLPSNLTPENGLTLR